MLILFSFDRDLEFDREFLFDFLEFRREWDFEEDVREEFDLVVLVAKSSGLTRERDSIPIGP